MDGFYGFAIIEFFCSSDINKITVVVAKINNGIAKTNAFVNSKIQYADAVTEL